MKILMLNYEFPPIGGGAANAHLHLLKEYAQKDNLTLDVLTSGPKPGFTTENFAENIIIYKVGLHKKSLHYWRKTEVLEWLFKARPRYRKLLWDNEYDLVHAFFGFPSGWLCYRTAEKLPYIISLRGSDVPGANVRLKLDYKILAPIFKAIWKKASVLVACSTGLKSRALAFMPSAKIDVIPNGVDTDKFHPAENKQKQGFLKLLTVGRLSPTKRVEILINSINILNQSGCKTVLTVVGGGAMEPSLRQMISEKNLDDFVNLKGRTEPIHMPRIYREHDIFVSATMQEGMSNAMLEAMASGLPIITTRCEGAEELITDNGVIIERANTEEIAKVIRSLADNSLAAREMAVAARSRAEQFTWSRAAGEYLALYERLK
jgi:glycosyltransferase involved in cell wall biosynthesis